MSTPNKSIAVIGVSFEFPSVNDLNQFWQQLISGKLCYQNKGARNETINAFGSVNNIENFDYRFFNYSFREACHMDPQHRLLLQHSWHALENAGYGNSSYRPTTAVYARACRQSI